MSNTPSDQLRRMLEASRNSPLAEADPKSMDLLMDRVQRAFNTRPLDLLGDPSDPESDVGIMTAYFRRKRANFATLAKERADAPKKTRGKTASPINVIVLNSDDVPL